MTRKDEDDIDAPYARKVRPEGGKPDQLQKTRKDGDPNHQEDLIDEGVDETFPASDPVSVKRIT